MRFARFRIAPFTAPLLIWLTSGIALAAPPSNDPFTGATTVTVPFSQMLDTTEATTDGDDTQLNEHCGLSATEASVWYAIEGSDETVVVSVLGSNYFAGVLVGKGSQGALQLVACGITTVAFFAEAGTTYYVLAVDALSGGGNGGSLSISFRGVPPPPPPPTLDINVNPSGTFNAHTGVATISGTYTCSNGDPITVSMEVTQDVGQRFTTSGFNNFTVFGTCDGVPHSWSIDVAPQNGKFSGGKSLTQTTAVTCGPVECTREVVEQTVQLRGDSQ